MSCSTRLRNSCSVLSTVKIGDLEANTLAEASDGRYGDQEPTGANEEDVSWEASGNLEDS